MINIKGARAECREPRGDGAGFELGAKGGSDMRLSAPIAWSRTSWLSLDERASAAVMASPRWVITGSWKP